MNSDEFLELRDLLDFPKLETSLGDYLSMREGLQEKARRERIIIAALQGILSNSDLSLSYDVAAAEAVLYADALLKRLNEV